MLKIRDFLDRKIDISWIIYGGIWGVIIGIGAQFVGQVGDSWLWWLVLIGLAIIGFVLRRKSLSRMILALLIGVLIGQTRAGMVFKRTEIYQQKINQTVEVAGRLFDDAVIGQSGMMSLRLSSIKIDGQPVVGKVLVMTWQKLPILRGDEIIVVGKLQAGGFGYDAQIKKLQSIQVLGMGDKMTQFRDRLDERLRRFLPDEQADLVGAILLGKRSAIDAGTSRQIRIAGLSHIVVASGMHLVIVVAIFRRLFSKISRRTELFGSLAGALAFALMAGVTPSMLRALMAMVLVMSAWYVGRKINGWRVMSVLVAVSLLLNPLYLNGDLSWWLSYGAFFAVIVVAPAVEKFFFGDQELGGLKRLTIAVIAIQLTLTPILLASFGELSLISVVANLLVVPLVLPLMWLASLVVLLADLAPLAWVVAYPLQLITYFILGIIDLLSQIPLAMIKIEATLTQIIAIVLGLILIIAIMGYKNWCWAQTKAQRRLSEVMK